MLVRSCLLITLIKCLKGHRSLRSLFEWQLAKSSVSAVSEWVSQWQGHLLSCCGQLKILIQHCYCIAMCTQHMLHLGRVSTRERRSRWGYNPSISVTASQLQLSSSLLTLAHCYCGRQTYCWNKSFTTDENSVWISKLLPSVGNIKLLNWLKPEQKPTAVGNGVKKTFKISLLRCKTNITNWKA